MSSKLKQSGIHVWLTSKDKKKEQVPLPNRSWLLNPNRATSGIHQYDIIAANDGVEEALDRDNLPATRRKRGQYLVYDSKTRLTIARVAEDCGLTKACTRLEKLLDHTITKSIVQSIRNVYELSDTITLQTGRVVRREFHFGLLSWANLCIV